MNLHISKSKNAESFYIAKSYVKSNGTTSSTIVRKLGTLNQRAKNTDQIQSFRWGVFMDGDGIPLAFSLFPGNTNEQKSLKPLEQKLIGDFGCQKFIYCSDAGLGSEDIRTYNHIGIAYSPTSASKLSHSRFKSRY